MGSDHVERAAHSWTLSANGWHLDCERCGYRRACGVEKDNEPACALPTAAPDAAEFAELLREARDWSERDQMTPAEGLIRDLAAALRKVLGDLTEAQRDIVATAQVLGMRAKLWDLPSNEKRAVALLERAERAEADLAVVDVQFGSNSETRSDIIEALSAGEGAQRIRAEKAEADLAREREAHEETRRQLASIERECGAAKICDSDDPAPIQSVFPGPGLRLVTPYGAVARLRRVYDAARAEVERLKAELESAETKWRGYERDYILPAFKWAANSGIDLETAVRNDKAGRNCVAILVHSLQAEADRLRDEVKDARDFQAQVARAVGATHLDGLQSRWTDEELHDVLKRLRAQLEPVGKLDVEALGRVAATAYGADYDGCDSYLRDGWVRTGAAVAQAFARAMLTDGAIDVANQSLFGGDQNFRDETAAGMRAALEHAGLHVAAEPVADESDTEVMLAAVREKMIAKTLLDDSAAVVFVRAGPEVRQANRCVSLDRIADALGAAFDAARAAAAADAERTRSVLMGALDRAKRLRVDPAKAATVPRATFGLPAPAAEPAGHHESGIGRDFEDRLRELGEPVAEGRACPVDVHEVGWDADCGLGYEVVEGIRVPDLHEINLMAQTIVWLVDEVRRLGGDRAANEKLDGYRELAARAADAENRRDEAIMLQASAEEETRRVRADLEAMADELAKAEQCGRDAERADVVADARKMAKRQAAVNSVFGGIGEAVLLDFADEVEAGRHVGAGKGETC